MLSGDGLVVRVRPFRGELNRAQVLGLCDLAERFGNGLIELTSRANLQLRGIAQEDHLALLAALEGLGLLDLDPSFEARRNMLVAPDRSPGDLTDRLCTGLLEALPRLPNLPEKMGYVIDTGARAWLGEAIGDFRLELAENGALLLRADGVALGRPVSEAGAIPAIIELADWFVGTGGRDNGRMARHVAKAMLPEMWQRAAPRAQGWPEPGIDPELGAVLGVPFGALEPEALRGLVAQSGASALRPLPGRMLRILCPQPEAALHPGFVSAPGAPEMRASACPGAPFCPAASVETRSLARTLARRASADTDAGGSLHVSGCAKGCAHPRRADLTLVGRDGRFDLVRGGAPWDPPSLTGLDPSHIPDAIRSA
ncbi:precorrin-3B synthase [Salipiger profundus]|uniref:Precorrin-3B synthase n=2 Tax=Roseobacteraceae TaxID=2854170 RepID=A0A1U7DBV5_9RHOB|nr:precorrin-3B synthase [Salipiger profundus]